MLTKMTDSESKEAIAERLKIMRIALDFDKQTAFTKAIASGITPQRWNNYESGRDRLTLNIASAIHHKFPQVTLDWLYFGDKGTLRPVFSAAIDNAEQKVKR
jgi:hypothetical protein